MISILISAILAIMVRNTVQAVLFLILVFFNASCWLFYNNIDYLALVLIIVYVGAIAVLFLGVVMMLNLKETGSSSIIYTISVGLVVLFTNPFFMHTPMVASQVTWQIDWISNIQMIGQVVFGEYHFPFILLSFLLTIGLVGVLHLLHRDIV